MIRGATIDHNVRHSPARSQKRNVRGGINRKSGPETNHQVAFCSGRFCPLQIATAKVLTKTDRSRLQKAATMTNRRLASTAKKLEVRLRIGTLPTGLTFN